MSLISDSIGDRRLPGRERLLDAAESLFYQRGYQSVGMDEIRAASGLPLKRIYALFPAKEALAIAMLDRRDDTWHADLAAYVSLHTSPDERVLAVFDWLSEWLAGPGHRGCAWINAFGELGGTSDAIAGAVQRHKSRFREYLAAMVADTGAPATTADAVFLLAEGCMVTAGITGTTDSAVQAQQAVRRLLQPATRPTD